jgi:hypothetical protein
MNDYYGFHNAIAGVGDDGATHAKAGAHNALFACSTGPSGDMDSFEECAIHIITDPARDLI